MKLFCLNLSRKANKHLILYYIMFVTSCQEQIRGKFPTEIFFPLSQKNFKFYGGFLCNMQAPQLRIKINSEA